MTSKNIIVAGIGTEVGKTVVSAILTEALAADYWKPVQAGDLDRSDSISVKSLLSNETSVVHEEAFQLTKPMSPHAAADIDNVSIRPEHLTIPETENRLVIEMAGGLMVPLSNDHLYIDWVQSTGFPVVLVSSYYLGSINHTLLSWDVLKSRNIPVLGIVFNGEKNPSTFDVIMHRTQAKCLVEVDKEEVLNADIIRKYASEIKL